MNDQTMLDIFDEAAFVRYDVPGSVPTDLWVEVLVFLEPKDALSVCNTCRILRSALNDRNIWALILRRHCHREEIFLPSYDINAMDLEALKKAALGPYRWGRLFHDRLPRAQLKPALVTEIPDVWGRELEDPRILETKLVLVPGGRYAVTADKTSLRLWDLGPAGADADAEEPVARIKSKSDCLVSEVQLLEGPELNAEAVALDLVVRIIGQHTLRIGVVIWFRSRMVIKVFDIGVHPEVPEGVPHPATPFSRRSFLEIFVNQSLVCDRDTRLWMQSSRVYVQARGVGIFWDFEVGEYALLACLATIRKIPPGRFAVAFTGASIVHVYGDSLSLWGIPFKERHAVREVPPSGRITLHSPLPPPNQSFQPLHEDFVLPDVKVALTSLSASIPHGMRAQRELYILQDWVESTHPQSVVFEVLCRPPPGHKHQGPSNLSTAHSLHRATINDTGGAFEVNLERLTSFVLPEGHVSFVPHRGIGKLRADYGRQSQANSIVGIALGLGFRDARPHPQAQISLRSVRHQSVQITDIQGWETASRCKILAICYATGRAVLRDTRSQSLHVVDYFAWSDVAPAA